MNNAEIAWRRLQNQGLAKTIFNDANDSVTQLGAVQAQDYAGAKWAVGQRLKGATDSAIEKAFADGSILRTHLMRPTWHFVAPEDIRWLLKLTTPRVHAFNAFMYRKMELEKTTLKKSNAVLEKALQGGKQLTRSELASALEKKGISTKDGVRLGLLMMHAELEGLLCSGARRGKQFTYALLEERVPPAMAINRDEALAELMKRYFTTRGPASLSDFTWWSGLTMADAKNGLEMIKSQFTGETINGQMYWFKGSISPAKAKSPIAWLLPNYDEFFIGFKDRSAIGDVAGGAGIKANDPTLIANIVLLDGQVAGSWKRTLGKDQVTVEIKPITRLSKIEETAIGTAADRFGKFLELPVKLIL